MNRIVIEIKDGTVSEVYTDCNADIFVINQDNIEKDTGLFAYSTMPGLGLKRLAEDLQKEVDYAESEAELPKVPREPVKFLGIESEPAENKPIIVRVDKGCVDAVDNVPDGYEVEVRDYDTEGEYDKSRLHIDKTDDSSYRKRKYYCSTF
jgi:hypothetical protein